MKKTNILSAAFMLCLIGFCMVSCNHSKKYSNPINPKHLLHQYQDLERYNITLDTITFIQYSGGYFPLDTVVMSRKNKVLEISEINILEQTFGDFNKDGLQDVLGRYKLHGANSHSIGLFQYSKDHRLEVLSFTDERREVSKHEFNTYRNDTLFLDIHSYYFTFGFRPKPTTVALVFDSLFGLKPSQRFLDAAREDYNSVFSVPSDLSRLYVEEDFYPCFFETYENTSQRIQIVRQFNDDLVVFTTISDEKAQLTNLDFILEKLEFLETNTSLSPIYKPIEEDILRQYEDGHKIIGDYERKNYLDANRFYSIMYGEIEENYLTAELLYVHKNYSKQQ